MRPSGMVVEDRPLSMVEITARAGLVLGAGTYGLQSLCALAGLPMVALPAHLEQLYHCRQSRAQGVLSHLPLGQHLADEIAGAILSAWADAGLPARARDFAQAQRRDYPANPGILLSRRLAPFAERARNAWR